MHTSQNTRCIVTRGGQRSKRILPREVIVSFGLFGSSLPAHHFRISSISSLSSPPWQSTTFTGAGLLCAAPASQEPIDKDVRS